MRLPDVQRLRHIAEYCSSLEKMRKRFGDSFEAFDSDTDYQYCVSFCLMQIGELTKGFSQGFLDETSDRIPWRAIRGMRNMFAHEYARMDNVEIWQTVSVNVPELKIFCEELLDGGTADDGQSEA